MSRALRKRFPPNWAELNRSVHSCAKELARVNSVKPALVAWREATTRAMENIDRNDAPPNSKAESILAAAKRSFLAAGFGAVSMDSIAREAGVSKATVY